MGCNFCTTSSFFGGKGKFVNFYETGDELSSVMSHMEASLKVQTFFIMEENFLLHRELALQLLHCMKQAGKSWGMAVFASANAIRKYTMQELVELGVSWVWMGLESLRSRYSKLQGTDTRQLTRELREHGIRVQGSTIIGLEHHTPENISQEIAHRSTEKCRSREDSLRASIWPTFMASINSTSATLPSHVTTPRSFSTCPARFRKERTEPLPDVPKVGRRFSAGENVRRNPHPGRMPERILYSIECSPRSSVLTAAAPAREGDDRGFQASLRDARLCLH
jgi:hypothetical protein